MIEKRPRHFHSTWEEQAKAAEAENEKLRTALKAITQPSYGLRELVERYDHDLETYKHYALQYFIEENSRVRNIARKVLEE